MFTSLNKEMGKEKSNGFINQKMQCDNILNKLVQVIQQGDSFALVTGTGNKESCAKAQHLKHKSKPVRNIQAGKSDTGEK